MAKQAGSEASSQIEINTGLDLDWQQIADSLPETLTINGKQYKSADLQENTRKLIAIYLTDLRIFGQQKEILALAELGLKSLAAEIERNLSKG